MAVGEPAQRAPTMIASYACCISVSVGRWTGTAEYDRGPAVRPDSRVRFSVSISRILNRLWCERGSRMKYLMFIKHSETAGPARPPQALMDAMGEFVGRM